MRLVNEKGTPTITQQELDRCVAEQQQKYRDLFAIHCSLARQRDALVAALESFEKWRAGKGLSLNQTAEIISTALKTARGES